ncbi:uncharacterized protein [Battus philenor]|uniref:uncharacterized protein n=1 Tax=Battus philenor TaxID=42288 RepID=UPI0035CFB879
MNILKQLQPFILFENVLFIFRNISYSSTKMRVLMFCALAAETLLSITNGVVGGVMTFTGIILKINIAIWHIRFMYEFVVMYIILCFMSEQLECIIRSVERKKTPVPLIYDPKKMEVLPNEDKYCAYLNEISQWSLAYTYLAEASNLFNKIFGVQNIHETTFLIKSVMKIMVYLVEILSLSRVAQRIRNNVNNLRRSFAKLLIETLNDEECYHATKDLLRLVSSRPIRFQAFGSISVDMSLPPTCVMFFTSYTVIALQFNNVL